MFENVLNSKEALARIDALLAPYLYLDDAKKDGRGGEMSFKFSNNKLGVSAEVISFLNAVSKEAKNWTLTGDEQLKVIDVLVLYSNHLDQHTNDQINPKMAQKVKESTVLAWLTSAKALREGYDTARELSTLAQLDHYYGKALRYKDAPLNEVSGIQETSVVLARNLEEKKCAKEQDPHQFPGRIESYELPFVYTLQKLGQYDYALTILGRHIASAPDAFLKVQALVQYAKTCCMDGSPKKGLSEAQEAYDLANTKQKSLRFNATQALMESLWGVGEKDKAVELASQLLEEQEKNPSCGIKDFHIEAANKIVEQYQQALRGMTI